MKHITTIISCLICNIILAQNLVVNPSFETYKYCPEFISNFNKNVTSWSTPTFATTDYFNTCAERMKSINHAGNQKAKTGNGYVGIYTFSDKNYREYIQGELRQKLEEGITYKLSFYVSLAEYSTHAISHIDVLFMPIPLQNTNSNQINIKRLSKQAVASNFLEIPHDDFYADTVNWIKIDVEYTALGFEKYFTIGNFSSNRKTKKQNVLSSTGKQFSYYYIDDVSVKPIAKNETQLSTEKEQESFENETIYTFKNVLFEFDKAKLLDTSKIELNSLYTYLFTNPDLNVEIYGHTDNTGTEVRNLELSQQRAQAVSKYLMSLGIPNERIQFFGYASSKPIATNTTAEGRELNRRVEFKLIKKIKD
ncbi:OmpA family protein [uncultured Psychroserpens sp.]|uniref:OmpA family protein n=1 Tax=uncultured Psychroserpens sp. TaxID=255436 RepID=UPI00261BC5AF|nr:OmpA family protein [uncultured Psychroserpens sp.]